MNLRAAGPGWLFCPADRPERFAKAAAAADVVILDLEDGVAEAQKPAARNALRDTPLDPERTVVRINAGGTADQARDLEALAGTAYTTVMLPKAESAAQVIELAPRDVIALVETARGAVCAAEIAAADPTVGMMWGAEDLIATLGGSSSRRADGAYRDVARHVRSTILLAASAFGRLAPATRSWPGLGGFWPRREASVGRSRSKARWSTLQCSRTRKRCCGEPGKPPPNEGADPPRHGCDAFAIGPDSSHLGA